MTSVGSTDDAASIVAHAAAPVGKTTGAGRHRDPRRIRRLAAVHTRPTMDVVGCDGHVPFQWDWRGVFVGAEGTFGVTVRIVAALIPGPEEVRTALASVPSL